MRNPLIRRIPRELKTEWHKYLVIIIFMVLMIGVISGMYVGHIRISWRMLLRRWAVTSSFSQAVSMRCC